MIGRRPRRRHEDAGASLIVAIAFMVMVGSISAGLIALATSGLNNRSSLDVVRNRQYAADAAIEQSIAGTRAMLGCSPLNGTTSYAAFNGVAIRVDWACTTPAVPSSGGGTYPQRNIIFSACASTPAPDCTSTPVIIRAQVSFQPASGPVAKTFVQSWNVNP